MSGTLRSNLTRLVVVTAGGCFTCLAVTPARGHAPIEGIGAFYNGLLHPFLVPAHLILLIGTGLLLGQQSQPLKANAWYIFVGSFWCGLAMGQTIGMSFPPILLLSFALVAGLSVVLELSLRAVPLTALMAFVGYGIGTDSKADAAGPGEMWLALCGLGIGGALLPSLVGGVSSSLERPWQRVGIRVAGSWIAAGSLIALAFAIMREKAAAG